ncbi:MAG: hypothetical protein DWQ04_09185 [Chloroflexi bacterium]|nr:MAG: hypothetical protein DWQ04_09185 [Chloroflexota bacterium]
MIICDSRCIDVGRSGGCKNAAADAQEKNEILERILLFNPDSIKAQQRLTKLNLSPKSKNDVLQLQTIPKISGFQILNPRWTLFYSVVGAIIATLLFSLVLFIAAAVVATGGGNSRESLLGYNLIVIALGGAIALLFSQKKMKWTKRKLIFTYAGAFLGAIGFVLRLSAETGWGHNNVFGSALLGMGSMIIGGVVGFAIERLVSLFR